MEYRQTDWQQTPPTNKLSRVIIGVLSVPKPQQHQRQPSLHSLIEMHPHHHHHVVPLYTLTLIEHNGTMNPCITRENKQPSLSIPHLLVLGGAHWHSQHTCTFHPYKHEWGFDEQFCISTTVFFFVRCFSHIPSSKTSTEPNTVTTPLQTPTILSFPHIIISYLPSGRFIFCFVLFSETIAFNKHVIWKDNSDDPFGRTVFRCDSLSFSFFLSPLITPRANHKKIQTEILWQLRLI